MQKFINLIICVSLCVFTNLASAHYVRDLNNKVIDFKDLQGKWVLINFWASWCEPCINEISEFNKLYAKRGDKIEIFAVNFDSLNPTEQKETVKKYDIKYPALLQSSVKNLNLGDIQVIPMTFIFNPQGRLTTKLYGGQSLASLEDALNDLVQR